MRCCVGFCNHNLIGDISGNFRIQRDPITPEAQLLSLIPDPFGLPDFIIQVEDQAVDESMFN